MFSGSQVTAALVALGALTCGADALAYRPFRGTDAAVADLGELGAKFGLAEPMRAGSQRFLASADARVNGRPVNELRAGVTFGLPLW